MVYDLQMKDFKKQLGRKIKQIRNSFNLTQEEFSTRIEIEVPSLSNIETGKSYPNTTTLKRLMDEFSIEPNVLFDFEHLMNEEVIDKEIAEIYKKLTLDKKQFLYRLITFLFELN